MPYESTALDKTLRPLRILHEIFLATMILYMYVLHIVPRTPAALAPAFFWPIAGLAIGCYCASLLVRARKVGPAIEKLRLNPDDAAALVSWRVGTILSDVTLECVALFGVSLYLQGATVSQVALFFVVPISTMLLLFPKRP